jgi:hypothetical protein
VVAPIAPAPAAPPPPVAAPVAAVATRTGSWFAGLDPRGWRTTIIVAVLMVGTVFAANFVNAAVPLPTDPGTPVEPGPGVPGTTPLPDDPGPVDPGPVSPGAGVEVGGGVVVFPPDGWTVVGSEQGQVIFQKAGVIFIAIAGAYEGSPEDLANGYREAFGGAMSQFSSGEPQGAQLGSGIPAVVFSYVGITDGSQVDGVIAAGVSSGTGVILNIFAPKGQLQSVADDLDVIGNTIQITPGGQG